MTRKRTLLTIAVLLLLLVLLWQQRAKEAQPKTTRAASLSSKAPAKSKTAADDLAKLYEGLMSAPQPNKEPMPFKSRGRVQLKSGESAVIGFWRVAKDSNGLAIVTPTVMPDGTLKLEAKILNVTDAVTQADAVRDLFPAPFDVEQYGALAPDATKAALKHLANTEGVDQLAMPSIITRPNAAAQIQIGEVDGSDQLKRGLSLSLNGTVPAADGSLDLDLALEVK